jgi:hypothetical protein
MEFSPTQGFLYLALPESIARTNGSDRQVSSFHAALASTSIQFKRAPLPPELRLTFIACQYERSKRSGVACIATQIPLGRVQEGSRQEETLEGLQAPLKPNWNEIDEPTGIAGVAHAHIR